MTSPSSVLNAPLVPLGRLGALLVARRHALELSIEEMAHRSRGTFTAAALSDIERARVTLDDPTMQSVAELYGLDKGAVIPERSRLVLDFHADRIRVGERSLPLHQGPTPIDTDARVDAVLERYLSLLYLLRNRPLGSRVSLREPDLIVLSATLQREMSSIESRLTGLMDSAGVTPQTQSLLKRFLLPSAGLLVAASSVGSLVIVNGAGSEGSVTTPTLTNRITVSQPLDQASGAPAQASGGIVPVAPDRAAHTREALPTTGGVGDSETESARSAATIARHARTAEERAAVGADAEALISYDWRSQLPGWTVTYAADDARYKGMTNVPAKTITVYLDQIVTVEGVAGVLAHEIGHALDVTHLDDETRVRWIESRDIAPVWWAGSGLNDFSVGSGDFAEAVARHLVNSPSDSTHGDFTDAQLTLVAELLPE